MKRNAFPISSCILGIALLAILPACGDDDGEDCGDITAAGLCDGSVVKRCVDGHLDTYDCKETQSENSSCAMKEIHDGQGAEAVCTRATHACGDVPAGTAVCEDNVAIFCSADGTEYWSRRCSDRNGYVCKAEDGDVGCYPSQETSYEDGAPCDDALKAKDVCDGTRLVMCLKDVVKVVECTDYEEYDGCAVDGNGEANCTQKKTGCGEVTEGGKCDGDTLSYCDGTVGLVTEDCAFFGAACVTKSGVSACDYPSCDADTDKGSCDGAKLTYCDDGSRKTVSCLDMGYAACVYSEMDKAYACGSAAD